MITYNWTISQLDRLSETGFITTAHWRCTAQDGEYASTVYSTASFPEGEPTIPYDNVTETQVLNWIWANGVDKDATEASLLSQIEALKNPVQQSGLPW